MKPTADEIKPDEDARPPIADSIVVTIHLSLALDIGDEIDLDCPGSSCRVNPASCPGAGERQARSAIDPPPFESRSIPTG